MMEEFWVQASSLSATHNAGKYFADSPQEACDMARRDYADSPAGRNMGDVGAYWFYTVEKFDIEQEDAGS